jgi:hypothetical protein
MHVGALTAKGGRALTVHDPVRQGALPALADQVIGLYPSSSIMMVLKGAPKTRQVFIVK